MVKGIDIKDGAEKRNAWDGSPCEHGDLAREYYRGSPTGDYVCTKCGAAGWGKDWVDEEKAKAKEKETNRQ